MASCWPSVLNRICKFTTSVTTQRRFVSTLPVVTSHKPHYYLNQSDGIRSCSSISNQNQIKVLYDGDCPLCVAEVKLLKKLNKKRNQVNFYDITVGEYRPEDHAGIPYKDAMEVMHVIRPDGQILTKMDAIREMYKGVGLGFLASFTKLPGVSSLADKGYRWFAINRYRMTGRDIDCETGRCRIKNR